MKFQDLEIGEKFQVEGEDGPIVLVKVEEEYREPYCPTNAENEELGGVWVSDDENIEAVK